MLDKYGMLMGGPEIARLFHVCLHYLLQLKFNQTGTLALFEGT